MGTPIMYSAKDMVCAKIDTWRELMVEYNSQFSPGDTLGYIKECCEEYDLDIKVVKEIFDECEEPYYYIIDKDEISNQYYFCEGDDGYYTDEDGAMVRTDKDDEDTLTNEI